MAGKQVDDDALSFKDYHQILKDSGMSQEKISLLLSLKMKTAFLGADFHRDFEPINTKVTKNAICLSHIMKCYYLST